MQWVHKSNLVVLLRFISTINDKVKTMFRGAGFVFVFVFNLKYNFILWHNTNCCSSQLPERLHYWWDTVVAVNNVMTLLRLLSNFSPSASSGILCVQLTGGAADPSSNELWHYFSCDTVGADDTEAGREAATDSWLTRKDFVGAGCKILKRQTDTRKQSSWLLAKDFGCVFW